MLCLQREIFPLEQPVSLWSAHAVNEYLFCAHSGSHLLPEDK